MVKRRDSFAEARDKMEEITMIAIKRVERRFDWYSFQGNHAPNGDHASFRWGKDKILYHWYEFEDYYGKHAEYEWLLAEPVLNFDWALRIPEFLYTSE